jgi:hypothetical protein
MLMFAKDDRPNRWVIFERLENGTLARRYSTNRKPQGMKRIPWPITYAANDSLLDRIRINSQP